ncbi:MAG TPA: hypothetical protein VIT91_13525 [Chthoniobacterales bacterium]
MTCNDPSIKHLKQFGYNVFRLPRADAAPLELLTKSGSDLTRLGHIVDVFDTDGGALPGIKIGTPGIGISGKETGQLDLGLGLNFLGAIIGAFGGNLGIKALYRQARSIVFTYEAVEEESVSPASLDAFLVNARVRNDVRTISGLLDSDDVYVFTSVLKTKRIGVEAFASDGVALKLDVPIAQTGVGGQVEVATDRNRESRLIYEGKISLAFGFQAVRLFYDQGQYQLFKIVAPGAVATRAHGGAANRAPIDSDAMLTMDAPLIRISGF